MGKKSGGRVRVKQVGPKAPVNPLDALSIPPEEMITFPVKPDTNVSQIWPMNETFTMDYKRFSCIYPTYMDSEKTVKQGRRIAAKDAVPNPTVIDIGQALQIMGIRHVVQPYKGYSRDVESQWDNLGRVLVDMEQPTPEIYDADDDNIMDDAKKSKKKLLKEIAKLLPSLPSRIQRLEKEKKELEEQQQKEAAGHKVASQKTSSSAKKKKGKKRR
eukprot:CAMPEP_0202480480 /NCGR_PEP_ID=MMETSP1361-20130828/454_1 /ASSEMBLY_ACC=CAM_ASM_000849 /TAXON_ID=210615 /ORGANISM="Staurosira complex sp., Strain CCMP2646" /LENGTH=214 /DNA_ID=CAMNT_0049107919 /DNA_START=11 /DNA_END=655 /DNA_ORIENTATION=+